MTAAAVSTLTLNLRAEPVGAQEREIGASDHLPLPPPRGRPLSIGWPIVLAFISLAIGFGGYRWWQYARNHAVTDNAFVAGDIHQISSRVTGTVIEVLVQDNARVAPGDVLFKLDPRDADLRVEQGRHQLTEVSAQVKKSEAQRQQAQAQCAQSEAKSTKAAAEFQRARLDFARAQHLSEGGRYAVISKQEVDTLQAGYDVAQASLQVAEADRQSSQALLRASQAGHEVALAQVQTAQVQLADAELQRSYATITAPVSGVIGRKTIEVGQRIQSGQALLAIVSDQKWVIANFKETQLARMRIAQPASIHIDAIQGMTFPGIVDSFSPASGAQFALLPPDNATGNFTKVVQRVPVKVVFEARAIANFESRIVPGLSAVVDIKLSGDRP